MRRGRGIAAGFPPSDHSSSSADSRLSSPSAESTGKRTLRNVDEVTNETFQPHVGTEFLARPAWDGNTTVEASAGDDPATLVLREVALDRPHGGPRAQPFRLVFEGTRDRPLEQGTYALNHAVLGSLDVFLVPIEPATYEAVFN